MTILVSCPLSSTDQYRHFRFTTDRNTQIASSTGPKFCCWKRLIAINPWLMPLFVRGTDDWKMYHGPLVCTPNPPFHFCPADDHYNWPNGQMHFCLNILVQMSLIHCMLPHESKLCPFPERFLYRERKKEKRWRKLFWDESLMIVTKKYMTE